jgi:hypothetical protein
VTVSVPRIEKLLAEATERPWHRDDDLNILHAEDAQDRTVAELVLPPDAALICEAVNALPVLIAAVKALDAIASVYPFDCRNEIRDAREALTPFLFEEQAASA